MTAMTSTVDLVATVSKHHVAGIVAIVIGAIVVVGGLFRVAAHAAGAMLIPVVGVVVLVLGILFFTRVI